MPSLRLFKLCLVPFVLLMCVSCTSVFYQPDRFMYYPPELNGFKQQNVYFSAPDGPRLHGWFFRNSKPKGTIVLFHGNGENLSSHYASLVWATRFGYQLFIFDYRGYGESLGTPDPEGVYQDGMAALDKAFELHRASGASKFIVYGQSLGGAVAMRCFADFKSKKETSLVVMDSTFMSYRDVAQEMLAHHWLTWIFSPLARILVSDKYATEDSVKHLATRLLVIHDKHDPLVDFENGQKIFDLAPGTPNKKELWSLDEGRHIGAFALDAMGNRKRFLTLLDSI